MSRQLFQRKIPEKSLIFSLFFFFLSFLFRVWHLTSYNFIGDKVIENVLVKEPFSPFLIGDVRSYEQRAEDILKGKGYNFPFHPPATSFLIAGIYFLFGNSPFYVKIFYSLLNSVGCGLLVLFSLKNFGEKMGIFVGLLISLSFSQMVICGTLNSEAIASFFLILWLLSANSLIKKKNYLIACLSGILLAILSLTRAEYQGLAVLTIFFGAFFFAGTRSERAISLLLILIFFILCILPWAIRNYVFLSRYNKIRGMSFSTFVPISYNGPINFYIGNNPDARGGFSREINEGAAQINPYNPKIMNIFYNGYYLGLKYIYANPTDFFRLLFKKLIIFFRGLSSGWLRTNVPMGLIGTIAEGDCFVPNKSNIIYFFIFLAVAGSVKLFLEKPKMEILLLMPVIVALLSNLLFFGLARSAIIVLPFLYINALYTLEVTLFRWKYGWKIILLAFILFLILAIGFDLAYYGERITVWRKWSSDPEIFRIEIYLPEKSDFQANLIK